MMIRELDVYKRAFKAAVIIHESALEWPKYEVYGGLADQIRRATRGVKQENYVQLAEEYAEIGRMLMGLMKRRAG